MKFVTMLSEDYEKRALKSYKKDVYPTLGDKLITDIEPADIIAILKVMKERGVTPSAKKVLGLISRVFQVAIANHPKDVKVNPCTSVSFKDVVGKLKKNHYPIITDNKELGILLNAIDNYTGDISTRLGLKLLAHVAVRPANVRFARWEDIDLETKQWLIPAEQMKMKRELIVPLSESVIAILQEAQAVNRDSELVFPSLRSKTTPMSDATLVNALRRIGYSKEEIVAHSFRGIFSTILHETNKFPHDVIEIQLAHSVGSQVSQAYNRAEHLEARVKMMDFYSAHLAKIQS